MDSLKCPSSESHILATSSSEPKLGKVQTLRSVVKDSQQSRASIEKRLQLLLPYKQSAEAILNKVQAARKSTAGH